MQKIVLVGYMAVGKSTIGKILAEKMKMKWVDLDKIIEEKAQLSITDIFKGKGEIFFRKQEHSEFRQLIESEESLVISTGGGTPCYSGNHLMLNGEHTISFYLKASIEELFERIKDNASERPLVANQDDNELKEFIAKNLFDRSYYYNQATFKIDTGNKSPETIAEEIMGLLD